MRKVLTLAAVLSVFAVPALAQQRQELTPPQPRAEVSATAAQAQPAAAEQAPSFHVSREQIREQVRAAEDQRAQGAQVGSSSWWYLVLAVAVGVLIAAVILD
ncbi:MAG TPA: hypothetical protein VFX98_10890 [Longimicrobiaceae bacterium]|nr:hypothetical protein [Longimicrobiaceae bacterium]